MAEETTHVRLRKTTLARLKECALSLIKSQEQNKRDDVPISAERINPAALPVTLDAVIVILLDELEKHREAGRKAAAKRKARGK